jgi:hypothetical protein
MSLIERINAFFAKLPFKGMMEKIPTETRAKVPILDKAIPFANQIFCGLAVALVITVIAASSGGKESESSDKGKSSGGGSLANTTWEGKKEGYVGSLYDRANVSYNFDKTKVRYAYSSLSTNEIIRAALAMDETGTYKVSGNTVTITWDDGGVDEGELVGNSFRIGGVTVSKK